ncbi:hypothetical protein [Microbulbifer litoralis]|uniref:hypothetical protein n=1 Tax=Microbulbifer litoralis TaxID=2933965 RepID=UPI002028FA4E|nr:hypothetical protein [Microbulbifer sp. GX H0434]
MNRSVKRGVAASCLLVLMMNLTACGYFLYPERKGQTGGRVDPVVVILDGAGLLFGILPGIVAFAVDFTNGTIYLPAGGSSAIDRHLTEADIRDAKRVIDQDGQVWLQLPIDQLSTQGGELQQLGEALSSEQMAAQDIIWLEDLAALRAASARNTASL